MSRKHGWLGGAALALVLGVIITVAVVVDYKDGARPGAAFPDISTFDADHKAKIELPVGTLTVQVGSPSQEYDVDFDETTRAADGAVFVPVRWEIAGAQVAVSNSLPVYQFQLALVADGRRYDLQAGHREDDLDDSVPIVADGSVATVVEGDGEDLDLEVEYDGQTQVLDVDSGKIDSGLAAPYYAAGGLKKLSTGTGCSSLSPADKRTFTALLDKCELGPVVLQPYVPGLGWVGSKTESWATVDYMLQTGSIQRRGQNGTYSTEVRRFDVTLDGAKPADDLLRYRNRGTVLITGIKVFKTSAAPKMLGLTTEIVGDSRFDGNGTRLFRTAQNFPLR